MGYRGAANGQEISVALDDVADNRIVIDAGHAGTGKYDIRRKFTLGNVERPGGNGRRTLAGCIECTQPFNAGKQLFIDLELGLIRDMYVDSPKIALAIVEGTNSDRVSHLIFADADQRTTYANVLFIDWRDFGKNELLRYSAGRRGHDIDGV